MLLNVLDRICNSEVYTQIEKWQFCSQMLQLVATTRIHSGQYAHMTTHIQENTHTNTFDTPTTPLTLRSVRILWTTFNRSTLKSIGSGTDVYNNYTS